jgi:hypothetical protein
VGGLAVVAAIIGIVFNVVLLIIVWRVMEAHESLARSVDDFVALQIKKDKREQKNDQP